jgi:GrpB protein
MMSRCRPQRKSPATTTTTRTRTHGSTVLHRPSRSSSFPYDAEWPWRFDEFVAGIRDALGEKTLEVEHVGSTSARGASQRSLAATEDHQLRWRRRGMQTVSCWLADNTDVPVTRLGYLWINEYRNRPQTLFVAINGGVAERTRWAAGPT